MQYCNGHVTIMQKESVFFVYNIESFTGNNAFNVYCRELAPGTVSLTGDRAQGDDGKHWAYSNCYLNCRFQNILLLFIEL